ncbi:hypothetical protein CKAH01_15723 [Colletotrichum kahawae]|uniref:Uncharacterized protein n=1 Tax=Colletotrichum kahawae TaxID=34407 RepID=A0AAE0D7X0_COLKA|nr:hypothetical protein CKAH01_15723 [Colletotrichum kahawae]
MLFEKSTWKRGDRAGRCRRYIPSVRSIAGEPWSTTRKPTILTCSLAVMVTQGISPCTARAWERALLRRRVQASDQHRSKWNKGMPHPILQTVNPPAWARHLWTPSAGAADPSMDLDQNLTTENGYMGRRAEDWAVLEDVWVGTKWAAGIWEDEHTTDVHPPRANDGPGDLTSVAVRLPGSSAFTTSSGSS